MKGRWNQNESVPGEGKAVTNGGKYGMFPSKKGISDNLWEGFRNIMAFIEMLCLYLAGGPIDGTIINEWSLEVF